MRIIAGTYRGRILSSPRDLSVRPTTDRAKQTIFDILANRVVFDGLNVLDLFSGSGSLGLEAISRGAASVTFVDRSRDSLELLRKNVQTLDCEDRCIIYQADVFWYLKNTKSQFDLVFVDPPYKLENIGTLPRAIYDAGILRENAYVVMEHSRESTIDLDGSAYAVTRKPFGQTTVLILENRG